MNVRKMICPKCKSTNIRRDSLDTFAEVHVLPSYRCNDCDYSGNVFPEIEDKKTKQKK